MSGREVSIFGEVLQLDNRPGELEVCAGGAVFLGSRLVILLRLNGAWLMPKGHCEMGETLEQTALREVEEETGLKAELGPFIGKTGYGFHDESGRLHNKEVWWYAMTAPDNALPRVEVDVFREYRLIDSDEIDALSFEADREIARRAFIWRDQRNA